MEPAFYTDRDVARRLNVSPEWVRRQRFNRAHGLDHIFDLVPHHIGGCVRYVADEVEAWIGAHIEQGRQKGMDNHALA